MIIICVKKMDLVGISAIIIRNSGVNKRGMK